MVLPIAIPEDNYIALTNMLHGTCGLSFDISMPDTQDGFPDGWHAHRGSH